MPERAQVFESVSIGVEALATPGVAVPTTRILAALSASVTPDPDVKSFIPKGQKFASTAVLIKETSGVKLDGIGTYNEMSYPMAGVLTNPVITTPVGAALARQHVFSMLSAAPDTPRTYAMEFGNSAVRAWHVAWAQMVDIGLTISRSQPIKISGSMLGQAIIDDKVRWLSIAGVPTGGTFTITVGVQTTAGIAYNATAATIKTAIELLAGVGAGNTTVTGGPLPASPVRIRFVNGFEIAIVPVTSTTDTLTGGATPASRIGRTSPNAVQLPIVPISPTEIDVYTAPTWAGLTGAAKLERSFKVDWKLSGRYAPIMPLNTSNGSGFAGMIEQTPKGEFSMDVAADDIGGGFLSNLRRGETVFVRASSTGPLIETVATVPFYHLFKLDTAMKLTKISELKDIDGGLMGVTYSGEWTHDPTWGYATQLTLQNTIAAL